MKRSYIIILIGFVTVCFASCVTDENSPGLEYMPDMYRSPAIEANVDYYFDEFKPGMTADSANMMRQKMSARIPPAGTIPFASGDDMVFHMPYPYANDSAGYENAGKYWKSPLPKTDENLASGKALFEKFCIHCHGEKGKGDGSITKKSGGEYPNVPDYAQRKGLAEGKMFHTLTYGLNLMGSHAYILNQKERWLVIQYVDKLMNGADKASTEEVSDENSDSEEGTTDVVQ